MISPLHRPAFPASPQARAAFLNDVERAAQRSRICTRLAYAAPDNGLTRQEELSALAERRRQEVNEGYYQRRLMWEEHDLCAGCGGTDFDWTKLCPQCKARYSK